MCFSPDGKRLATASQDNTAKIWDVETGQGLFTLQGHAIAVWYVCYSRDGKRLATASYDKTAKVWDAETGRQLITLQGHTSGVLGVCFSPDGKRLATASLDNTAKIWDAETAKQLFTLQGHMGRVEGVGFSPDGRPLATELMGVSAKIWDAESGRELLKLQGNNTDFHHMWISPDGKRLATASFHNTAMIWDAETGRQLLTLQGHTKKVSGVCFSPDGKRLATASWDKTAKIWDMETGGQLYTLQGHTNWVQGVCFSPDGKRLATASLDKTAKIWDVSPAQIPGRTTTIPAPSPEGGTAPGTAAAPSPAVAPVDQKKAKEPNLPVEVTNSKGKAYHDAVQPLRQADGLREVSRSAAPKLASFIAYGADKRTLLSAGVRDIALWQTEPMNLTRQLSLGSDISGIAYSRTGGDALVINNKRNTIAVYDLVQGRQRQHFTSGLRFEFGTAQFTPIGVGAVDDGHFFRVWNLPDGRLISHIDLLGGQSIPGGLCCCRAMSHNGQHAACGGNGVIVICKQLDRTLGATEVCHVNATQVHEIQISDDASRVAYRDWSNTIGVWDFGKGQALKPFGELGAGILACSFALSRDGRRLITIDNKAPDQIRLWDLDRGREIAQVPVGGSFKGSLRFAISPDGAAAASCDGTAISIWELH